MPLKYPDPAGLPPGFVLDPPSASTPTRAAAPQRRALMGPDYGQNFLQQSLHGSPPEQWRQAEDPTLADRLRQARSLWSQRLAIERERDLAEIERAYLQPEEAPLSLRPLVPKDSRQRDRRLSDVREQLDRQRALIAKEAQDQSVAPQNEFERKYAAATGFREKAATIAANPAGAAGALSPSLIAATPEMAMQLSLARGGHSIGRGVAAVAGIGFGSKSAYEQEYAAELMHSLSRQGVDVWNERALQKAMSDTGVMATAHSEARKKASIVAAGGGIGGVLGARMLTPTSLHSLGREMTNLAAQLPAQTLISSITEAASQWASRGEIESGDVLLSALGGLLGAPGQVAEARVGGYRQANPSAKGAVRPQAHQGSGVVGKVKNAGSANWKEVIAAAISPAMLAPVDTATAPAGGYRRRGSKLRPEPSSVEKVQTTRTEDASGTSPKPESTPEVTREGVVGNTEDSGLGGKSTILDVGDGAPGALSDGAGRQAGMQALAEQLRYRYLGWNHEQKKFSRTESMAIARAERKLGKRFRQSDIEGIDLFDPTGWGRISIKGPFLSQDGKPLSDAQQKKAIRRIRQSVDKGSAVETHLIDLTGLSDAVKKEMRDALANAKVKIVYIEE